MCKKLNLNPVKSKPLKSDRLKTIQIILKLIKNIPANVENRLIKLSKNKKKL